MPDASSKLNNGSAGRTNVGLPIADTPAPYRILSMDGGGIYGAFTALMLRQLCDRDEHFLSEDQVTLFAGTSAGAINALLLAKHARPRAAVQDGVLEGFFKDARVYSNRLNPVTGALSFLALTSWSGKADFYAILEDHFQDMRMKDLEHRVMITAFDFRGAREQVFGQRQWKPKIFCNFPEGEPDRELYVKDVAYGAASPPTLRPVVNGITDGGFFASDPSAFAIAKIVSRIRDQAHPLLEAFDAAGQAFAQGRETVGPLAFPSAEQRVAAADRLPAAQSEALVAPEAGQKLAALRIELMGDGYGQRVDKAAQGYEALVKRIVELSGKTREAFESELETQDYETFLSEQPLESLTATGADRSVLTAFVRQLCELLDWELRWWRELTGILTSAGLPAFAGTARASRIERGIRSMAEVTRRAETLCAALDDEDASKDSADARVDGLRFCLLRAGQLRNGMYETLSTEPPQALLQRISILSLGVGAMIPNYFLSDFDFGVLPFNLLPTNPLRKFYGSPLVNFALNPAKDATTYEAKQLLGEENYFRLDPPVIGFPVPTVINAAYLARFYVWRQFILERVQEIARSDKVKTQVAKAAEWMCERGWQETRLSS